MNKLSQYFFIDALGALFVISGGYLIYNQSLATVAGVCLFIGAVVAPIGWASHISAIVKERSAFYNSRGPHFLFDNVWVWVLATCAYIELTLSMVMLNNPNHVFGACLVSALLPFPISLLLEILREKT